MPSTYTLNNGIELIGTGEQSGTWGDTTNTNLQLLDTALDGQVTVTLASAGSSGSPNTLPISDGAASNGRNRMVIFNDGGDLGATAYVQLTPNDAEKIIYVRNSLSGSRSILLFQGTYNASNDYEVPAGTTAVIYFDGAGTGAVAANVFNNAYFDSLRLGGVSVTAILDEDDMSSDSATALATQQSIKAYVDSQVGTVDTLSEILANGNTTGGNDILFGDNDKAIFGAGSDLQIYHDGTHSRVNNNTGDLFLQSPTVVRITNSTASETAAKFFEDGAVELYHDNSRKLATSATGVDITGTLTSDGLTVDGDAAIQNTGDGYRTLSIGANRSASVNTLGRLDYDWNGTPVARIHAISGTDATNKDNGDLVLSTSEDGTLKQRIFIDQGGDISFYEDTGTTAKFFWDASAESLGIGTSSPQYTLNVGGDIVADGDFNTRTIGFDFYGALKYNFHTDGTVDADKMFIRKGTTNVATFDTAGNVGIGTSTPAQALVVNRSSGNTYLEVSRATQSQGQVALQLTGGTGGTNWIMYQDTSSNDLKFFGNSADRMTIDSSGNVGIGTSSLTGKAHIYKSSVNSAIIGTSYNGHYFESQSDDATDGFEIYQKHGSNTTRNSFIVNDNRTGSKSVAFLVRGDGNVGIGTTSPSAELEIAASSAQIRLTDTDTNAYAEIGTDGSGILNFMADEGNTGTSPRITFDISTTERMRIDSSGNVGIGTSSPLATLDVSDSTLSTIRSTSGSYQLTAYQYATGFSYLLTNGQLEIGTSGATILALKTNNTERLRIESGGDIEIKTASKYLRFNSPSSTFDFSGQPAGTDYLRLTTSSSGNFFFYADGALYNTTGTYGTISDLRLKENVVDATSKLDELMQLRVVNYNFKTSPDTKMLGFIAQEVEQVFPSLVEAGEEVSGEEPYKSIKTSVLVPMLVKAIQEQQLMIEALKTEMTSVKARLDALEGV
jgi:hypothetical protein